MRYFVCSSIWKDSRKQERERERERERENHSIERCNGVAMNLISEDLMRDCRRGDLMFFRQDKKDYMKNFIPQLEI